MPICSMAALSGVRRCPRGALVGQHMPPRQARGQPLHPIYALRSRMILQEMLEDAGAQVTFAADGAEAVTAIKHAAPPFDVILCDIEMPNMDGYEAARSIKARALRSSDSRRMPLQQRGT